MVYIIIVLVAIAVIVLGVIFYRKTPEQVAFLPLIILLILILLSFLNIYKQDLSTKEFYEKEEAYLQRKQITRPEKMQIKESLVEVKEREKLIIGFIKESSTLRLHYTILALGGLIAFLFRREVPMTKGVWSAALLLGTVLFLVLSLFYGFKVTNAITGALDKGYNAMTYGVLQHTWILQEQFFLYGFICAAIFVFINLLTVIVQTQPARSGQGGVP